jgi:hypothetical protein
MLYDLLRIKYFPQGSIWHVACVDTTRSSAAHDDQSQFVARDNAARRARLCEAILRHMQKHPLAADTAEGILACWIPKTTFEDAPDHIGAVLDHMVARQWLRARQLPDGRVLYQRGEVPDI